MVLEKIRGEHAEEEKAEQTVSAALKHAPVTKMKEVVGGGEYMEMGWDLSGEAW